MENPDWRVLADELTKSAGALRVASLLKRAYASRLADMIAEFDRVATDEQKAIDFVKDMATSWWGVRGPNQEYFEVEMDDWQQVVEHIHLAYPNIRFPGFLTSQAHKSALVGKDPQGKVYDKR